MEFTPIGFIRTPFRQAAGTPLQPPFAEDAPGEIEIEERFAEGLRDLDAFERIWLLFWCDRTVEPRMIVKPYRSQHEHGLFATRAPARPNPIGLSCVKLIAVEGRIVRVAGVDILDGAPIIDIKPYIPEYDAHQPTRLGWMRDDYDRAIVRADDRFEKAS